MRTSRMNNETDIRHRSPEFILCHQHAAEPPSLEERPVLDGTVSTINDIGGWNGGDRRLNLLVGELNHRLRNLLAMVEVIIRQTQSSNIGDYRAKLLAKISGFSRLHELMCLTQGGKVRFHDLLDHTLSPYRAACGSRFHIAGPDIDLESRLAFALHLVIHELATNALKYGSLSSPDGSVHLSWSVVPRDGRVLLHLSWEEAGGPRVTEPARAGFGSFLIEYSLSGGQVRREFNPGGVTCTIEVPIGTNKAPDN